MKFEAQTRRGWCVAAAMALLTVGATASPAVAAVTAPEPHSQTHEFKSNAADLTVITRADALSDAELAPLQAYFGCDIAVQWPHGSVHVSGTINVVATATCDIPARIRLAVELYRVSPYARWVGTPKVIDNTTWVKANAAAPCSAGPATFTGRGIGTITAPPGYVLNGPATYYEDGDERAVACGLAFAANDTQTDRAQTIRVEFIRSDLAATQG